MSFNDPHPQSLLCGIKGSDTAFDRIRILASASLTPGALSLSASSWVGVLSGVYTATDQVIMLSQPAQSSIDAVATCAQIGPADQQVTIFYTASSGTAVSPNPGVYTFLVLTKARGN